MLKKFIDYLLVQIGSIYIWGGQGQTNITEDWIKKVETSTTNANRAIKLWKKRVKEGYANIRAFDCSGLGTYFLYNLERILPTDKNSNGLKGLCKEIKKTELKRGDWVFRIYKTGSKKGRAYHIGYIVDAQLNVVEARGRDYGVVKRSLNASGSGYWNCFGRPKMFEKEIEGQIEPEVKAVFSRYLKYKKPYLRGDDVKNLQKLLKDAGHSPGSIDGIFGKNTRSAVKAFQKAKKLKIDGIVGADTSRELNAEWRI